MKRCIPFQDTDISLNVRLSSHSRSQFANFGPYITYMDLSILSGTGDSNFDAFAYLGAFDTMVSSSSRLSVGTALVRIHKADLNALADINVKAVEEGRRHSGFRWVDLHISRDEEPRFRTEWVARALPVCVAPKRDRQRRAFFITFRRRQVDAYDNMILRASTKSGSAELLVVFCE